MTSLIFFRHMVQQNCLGDASAAIRQVELQIRIPNGLRHLRKRNRSCRVASLKAERKLPAWVKTPLPMVSKRSAAADDPGLRATMPPGWPQQLRKAELLAAG